jgi:predicted nucleic acid-binding protein
VIGDLFLKKIYVDSNIFVDAEIPERKFYKESKEFFNVVLNKHNIRICTSVYTLLEIASAITRQIGKRDTYKHLYNVEANYREGQVSWLYPSTKKKLFDFEKLVRSLIETSIRCQTPSGDTIHAQTLIANRIKTLITRNKDHFKNLKRKEVLLPEEFLQTLE